MFIPFQNTVEDKPTKSYPWQRDTVTALDEMEDVNAQSDSDGQEKLSDGTHEQGIKNLYERKKTKVNKTINGEEKINSEDTENEESYNQSSKRKLQRRSKLLMKDQNENKKKRKIKQI